MSAAPVAVRRKPSLARSKPLTKAAPKESSQPSSTAAPSEEINTEVVQLQCSPKSPIRRLGSASERGVLTTVPPGQQNVQGAVGPTQSIGDVAIQSVSAKEGDGEVCTSGSEVTNEGLENEETGLRFNSELGTPVQNWQYLTILDTAKLRQEVETLDRKAEKKVAMIDSKESLYATKKSLVENDRVDIQSTDITDNSTLTEDKSTRPLLNLPANDVLTEPSPRNTNSHQAVEAEANCQKEIIAVPDKISPDPGTSSKPDTSEVVDAVSLNRANGNGCLTRDCNTKVSNQDNDLENIAARTVNQPQLECNISTPKTKEEEHQIPREYGIDYPKGRANNNPTQTNGVKSPESIIKTALALRSEVSGSGSAATTLNNRDIVQQLLIATERKLKVAQSEGGVGEGSESSRRESGRSSCSLPTYCGRPPSVDPDNAITAAVASQAPKELASEMIYRVMHECRFNGAEDLEVKAEELVKGIPDPENPYAGKKTLVASVCRPGRRGYVPNFFLRRITQIDFEPWYLGKITRQYSEQLLLECDLPVRSFLVLHSGLGYIISVKSLNDDGRLIVKHKTIAEVNGKYTMFNRDFFDTIPKLVSFHTTRQGGYCFSHPFQKPKLGLSPGIMAPAPVVPMPQRCQTTSETPSLSTFKWWSLGFFGRKSLRKIRPTGAANEYNQFP